MTASSHSSRVNGHLELNVKWHNRPMRSSTGSGRIFGYTDISSTLTSIGERHLSIPPSVTSVPLAWPNLLASHL